jgi:hypothetical protein
MEEQIVIFVFLVLLVGGIGGFVWYAFTLFKSSASILSCLYHPHYLLCCSLSPSRYVRTSRTPVLLSHSFLLCPIMPVLQGSALIPVSSSHGTSLTCPLS